MEIKWIDNKKRKPKKGDEYLAVWNLNDGHYPVTTSLDWDAIKKEWTDPRSDNRKKDDDVVLFWARLPRPPKGIKRSVYTVK